MTWISAIHSDDAIATDIVTILSTINFTVSSTAFNENVTCYTHQVAAAYDLN